MSCLFWRIIYVNRIVWQKTNHSFPKIPKAVSILNNSQSIFQDGNVLFRRRTKGNVNFPFWAVESACYLSSTVTKTNEMHNMDNAAILASSNGFLNSSLTFLSPLLFPLILIPTAYKMDTLCSARLIVHISSVVLF